MLVYLFYVEKNKLNIELEQLVNVYNTEITDNNGISYILYAWTANKKYKKKFEEFRNMNIFHIIERHMLDDDFREFNHNMPELEIMMTDCDSKFLKKPLKIYSTNLEIEIVNEEFEKLTIYLNDLAPYTRFMKLFYCSLNKNIRDRLNSIGFIELIHIIDNFSSEYSDNEMNRYMIFNLDSFSRFLDIFGETIKLY